jgi:hypothetical protein
MKFKYPMLKKTTILKTFKNQTKVNCKNLKKNNVIKSILTKKTKP